MSNSTFDPAMFLETTFTEANATVTVPVPVGEYLAVVEKVEARKWEKDDKSGIALDVQWSIDDQAVKEFLGRDKVTVKQGVMLDLNESGGLDVGVGKNVKLGRLREALGLNVPGAPFAFLMMTGRPAKVKVEHRVNGEDIYAEVKSVASAM
jgi:hypothetical protein